MQSMQKWISRFEAPVAVALHLRFRSTSTRASIGASLAVSLDGDRARKARQAVAEYASWPGMAKQKSSTSCLIFGATRGHGWPEGAEKRLIKSFFKQTLTADT